MKTATRKRKVKAKTNKKVIRKPMIDAVAESKTRAKVKLPKRKPIKRRPESVARKQPSMPGAGKGRKSKYFTHVAPRLSEIIEWVTDDGLIDKEICERLNINLPAFYQYQRQFPNFSAAVRNAKDNANRQIEAALHKRAVGFQYEEICETFDIRGKREILQEKKKTTKNIVPDVSACMFLLKNRMPMEYKDKQEHDLKGEVKFTVLLPDELGGEGRSSNRDASSGLSAKDRGEEEDSVMQDSEYDPEED